MNETTLYLLGILILASLIFLREAKTIGEFGFLSSLLFIGGGWFVVMIGTYIDPRIAFFATPLTAAGIITNRAASCRDIKIPWRAQGLHSTTLMCCFVPCAALSILILRFAPGPGTEVLWVATAVYIILAAWHTLTALRAAWRVLINYDGRSK